MAAESAEKDKYIIIGVGGSLSDIFDTIHACNGIVAGIYQNMPEVVRDRVSPLSEKITRLGYPVDVYDSLDSFQVDPACKYVLGCVTPRKKSLVAQMRRDYQLRFEALIHPSVCLGSNVRIGEGVLIFPGAVIGVNAVLDDFCVIGYSVYLGHDARVEQYARVCPSVAIGGASQLGEGVSVGIGATIVDRIHIGAWSVIGAGSLVNKDIPDQVVAYGVPARVVRENAQ